MTFSIFRSRYKYYTYVFSREEEEEIQKLEKNDQYATGRIETVFASIIASI